MEKLTNWVSEGAAKALGMVVTGWMKAPTLPIACLPGSSPSPSPSPSATPTTCTKTGEAVGAAANLQAATAWIVGATAVAALLWMAGRLVLTPSGRTAAELAKNFGAAVLLMTAGLAVVETLRVFGDQYSIWIINQSLGVAQPGEQIDGSKLGDRLLLLAPTGAAAGTLAPVLLVGVSVLLIIVTITQLVMLYGRAAALVLLAGLLPVAAVVGIAGGAGKQMRQRYVTWLIAMLLYKPVAATIYAAAFWSVGTEIPKDPDLIISNVMTGLMLFVMALVALPALMRLITPAVEAVAGGGSSAGAAVGGAAVGQIAQGAVQLGSSRSSSSSGGGGQGPGSNSPPGATPSGGGMPPATPGAGASGGGAAGGAAGGGAAGGAAAGAGAGAAAAGPVGLAVAAGVAAVQATQGAINKLGGTAAAGATGPSGEPPQ
ncbi:hypothetical protein OOJ91_22315 [Micromonospora lupini]|uniref:hypothetical protein n=1 Tax=Micromonospora lupini TaxID=285679 RepID=UPI002259006E|nr:hypothetical protein [Micromonospora lupini]MCX5068578.1 hypothetical protein [Micromonospora lupini]